jgi:hypothetical protein
MVATAVSTAVMTWPVPAPIVVAIAPIETRAVVITWAVIVGIGRIAGVVIRRGIHIVTTGVVIAAG